MPLAAPGIPPGLVTAYADCAREVGVASVAEIYRPSTLGQEIVRSEQLIAAIVACVEPNGYVEEDLPIVRLPTGQRLFDERAIGDDEVGAVVTECLREGPGRDAYQLPVLHLVLAAAPSGGVRSVVAAAEDLALDSGRLGNSVGLGLRGLTSLSECLEIGDCLSGGRSELHLHHWSHECPHDSCCVGSYSNGY